MLRREPGEGVPGRDLALLPIAEVLSRQDAGAVLLDVRGAAGLHRDDPVALLLLEERLGRAPRRIGGECGRADGLVQFKQVDIRIAKQLEVAAGHHASAFLEVFNLFNWYNYSGYDGFIAPLTGDPNPNYGKPNSVIGPTRSLQLGLSYGF